MRSKKNTPRPLVSVPPRFSDVLSRVRIDLGRAIERGKGADFTEAAAICRDCGNAGPCSSWIQSHEEGGGAQPPHFCRIQRFLKSAAPAVPINRKKSKSKKPAASTAKIRRG